MANRRDRKKGPIQVRTVGNPAAGDVTGLAKALLQIHKQQQSGKQEMQTPVPAVRPTFEGTVANALDENMWASAPPAEPGTSPWIHITERLPAHDRFVQVWNTAVDRIEEALYDTVAGRWQSKDPLTVYLFGEITHWHDDSPADGETTP